MMYLCSAGYAPEREHTISPMDPAIGIDRPKTAFGAEHVVSERDRDAPSLEQVRAAGLLPTWAETSAFVAGLGVEGLS